MLYIFLDVDGVLNCHNTENRIGAFIGVDDSNIRVLKKLLDEIEYPKHAKLILSSSWRLGGIASDESYKYLNSRLAEHKIYIDDITPRISGYYRGAEILSYLIKKAKFNPEKDNFLIVDDEEFDFEAVGIADRHLKTEFYGSGLRFTQIRTAVTMLNVKPKGQITEEFLQEYLERRRFNSSDIEFAHSGKQL